MRRLVAVGLLVPLLAACGDKRDEYCAAVKDHQKELGEVAGGGSPDALIRALSIFRQLRGKAPSDITDEWQQVVTSIEGLQKALDEADVDPRTYDLKKPPAGLTDAEQKRIADAATEVGSAETIQALKDLDQQARDVCHTPLSL